MTFTTSDPSVEFRRLREQALARGLHLLDNRATMQVLRDVTDGIHLVPGLSVSKRARP